MSVAASTVRRVGCCMGETISVTLEEVRSLSTPVVRSCHVGNNSSNVWGWLALAGNSRLVQFDHTRYGLDENCMPWTVLADDGRIAACFDQDGRPQPAWRGRPINDQIDSIDRRYHAMLNYQIFADLDGEDLIRRHVSLAQRLAERMNRSSVGFDTSEIVAAGPLVESVLTAFIERGALALAVDRWVESRASRYLARPVTRVDHGQDGNVTIFNVDGAKVFSGTARDLSECFVDASQKIDARLRDGLNPGPLSYPWLTLELSYLIQSVVESSKDPSRAGFWHAGGSSSQYYINAAPFQQRMATAMDLLAEAALLPSRASLTFIPTFPCQLFACTSEGLVLIEKLIDLWQGHIACSVAGHDQVIRELGSTTDPLPIVSRYVAAMPEIHLRRIDALIRAFNAIDPNHLPVAHVARQGRPTYNKFGAAQENFLTFCPMFPKGLKTLRWGEAELLVKVIAHLYAGEAEPILL